jgi:hypothetical protein
MSKARPRLKNVPLLATKAVRETRSSQPMINLPAVVWVDRRRYEGIGGNRGRDFRRIEQKFVNGGVKLFTSQS